MLLVSQSVAFKFIFPKIRIGRGNLFFEIARVVDAKRPVIFLENVQNLVEHDNGKTFLVIYKFFSIKTFYSKLALYVTAASLSISFAQTISNPACLKPKSIPPIPENKLLIRKLYIG